MSITFEKDRLVREIKSYLRGRHDEDKKRIGQAALVSIPIAVTYRELLTMLRAFHGEIMMLVGRKNATRWFAHAAGGLAKIFAKGIERCGPIAVNEERISGGVPSQRVTVIDWARHRGGEAFSINGQAFALNHPTIDQIKDFLLTAGIANPHIRQFIADFSNQEGLWAVSHMFPMASREATGYIASATGRSSHIITSGSSSKRVSCRDTVDFSPFVGEIPLMIDPPVMLVCSYELVEEAGKVHVAGTTYELQQLAGLPEDLRKRLPAALGLLNTLRGDVD